MAFVTSVIRWMPRGHPDHHTWDKCHVLDVTVLDVTVTDVTYVLDIDQDIDQEIFNIYIYKLANFFDCANYSQDKSKDKTSILREKVSLNFIHLRIDSHSRDYL